MRVLFAGTPDFAAAALKSIVEAGFDVPLVLTQPDRPKGRGLQLQASPVKQFALQHQLPIAQPQSLRNDPNTLDLLTQTQADVMVVAAYGLILPQNILDLPRHGCLNIHASLLPRWRGAAPIQRAIEAGDSQTGVCIMQMDAGLDTGDIVSEHRCAITAQHTAQTLHDELMNLGAQAIVADLRQLRDTGSLKRTPQSTDGITYAHKIHKDEAQINWQRTATELDRHIRAFNPTPTAWTTWQTHSLKIWAAHAVPHPNPDSQNNQSGRILSAQSDGLIVACGENGQDALCITELQLSGSKRMSVAAFLAGREIKTGDLLL